MSEKIGLWRSNDYSLFDAYISTLFSVFFHPVTSRNSHFFNKS